MQYREKAGQTLTEPITAALVRTYMGFEDTSQDTLIGTLITAARLWLENRTGCSVISKIYEAEFERDDGLDNWYELPFYPVTSITTVEVEGATISYYERGLNMVEIYPLSSISTGTSNNTMDVEFVAGASSNIAIEALYRMVADLYNTRTTGVVPSAATFQWDTMNLINQLSKNTSI